MVDGLFDFDVTEVDGGYDVELAAKGYLIVYSEVHDGGVSLKLRDISLPRIGSHKMIDGKAIKVKSIEGDKSGRVFVVDESTGDKLELPTRR